MNKALTAPVNAAGEPDHGRRMDAIYRSQRHFYDLTRKYYLLGRDRLIGELDLAPGQSVLEIGCGTGRNLVHIGKRWPGASLYGLDISSEMLLSARAAIARAGLTDHAKVGLGDAAAFDARALFGHDRFDRIVFSFTLSMIPAWRQALDHACTLLAPGGRIMVVDFGQQERLPALFRLGLEAWLRKFHVTPRAELMQELETLAARHGLAAHSSALWRGYSWLGRVGA